jgi:hypothetical protein
VAGKIGRIDPGTGSITEYPVGTANSQPQGITIGSDGNLWFTEAAADNVGKITPSGTVTEYPLPSPLAAPNRIISGPGGDVWFTESGKGAIGHFDPANPPSGTPNPAVPVTADSPPLAAVPFPDFQPGERAAWHLPIQRDNHHPVAGRADRSPVDGERDSGHGPAQLPREQRAARSELRHRAGHYPADADLAHRKNQASDPPLGWVPGLSEGKDTTFAVPGATGAIPIGGAAVRTAKTALSPAVAKLLRRSAPQGRSAVADRTNHPEGHGRHHQGDCSVLTHRRSALPSKRPSRNYHSVTMILLNSIS